MRKRAQPIRGCAGVVPIEIFVAQGMRRGLVPAGPCLQEDGAPIWCVSARGVGQDICALAVHMVHTGSRQAYRHVYPQARADEMECVRMAALFAFRLT